LTQYIKRYRYQGNLDLKYNHLVLFPNGEKESSDQFWVTWNHNSNSRKSSSFTSSVSFGSTNYNRYNSYSPGAYLSNQFNSTVSYYKTFANTPFYLGISGRHDQNVVGETSIVNLNLPEVNFGMNRIYPFKRKIAGGKRWYEQINVSYNLNSKYFLTNNPGFGETDTIPFTLSNIERLMREKGQFGTRHSVPVTTSIKLLRHFSLNPNVNYEEIWYLKQLQHTLDPATNTVITDTTSGFYRVYSFSAGTSLTTQVYGTYRLRSKVMPAIRHTLIPSISYNYRPDFSKEPFNYYNRIIDTSGQEIVLSKYNGFIYGTPGSGRSNLLGFSFQNSLEAKVRDRKDTTNELGIKKIKLIENIGLTGNYNFTADSLHLSQISLNARTRLFNRFDINFSSLFDPYATQLINNVPTRINRFAIDEGQGIARLINYNLSFSTSLNPKQRSKIYHSPNATEEELRYINRHPELYVDFTIPWNLNISYNLNFARIGIDEKNVTQTLSFNGDVKLTDKWKVGFNSGWDFVQKGISYTQFNIYRDLHCWEMRLSVIPFGIRQSYSFDINVKASVLQDLKLNRKRDWYDNSLR
ncbi:MAG TPA: putative LPS assembly protein LptD, partial [Cytophagaceae bacterium]